MNIRELIDLAKERSGMTLGQLADDLGKNQNRISEWRVGKATPDAGTIAYFANKAGLPVFETVAEIEAQLDKRHAPIWQAALGKLRAAGVAATVTLGLVISSTMIPTDASAALTSTGSKTTLSARRSMVD